jgi:hypothetical protein
MNEQGDETEPLTFEQRVERVEAAVAELGRRSIQMTGNGGFASLCPSATAIMTELDHVEADRRAAALAGGTR